MVYVEGRAEIAKRKIETYKLSSVPAFKPFSASRPKAKKLGVRERIAGSLSPPRRALPPPKEG
jgi:hypothetical protein